MRDHQGVRADQPVAAEAPIPRRPPRQAIPGRSAEVRDAAFHSRSLGRTMQYRVLLPEAYDREGKRYPVVYLLHGVFGDHTNWDSLTGVAEYAHALDMIVAMPDGDNSWYTNSGSTPADRFEDYVVEDFVSEIDARYRTRASGESRAVAGLSMGGYAAVKFALKYPERFAFAGSISGAFDATADLHERRADLRERLLEVYGATGHPVRAANDVFRLAATAHAKQVPVLYLDCGTEDEFLSVNRRFSSELKRKDFRCEYVEAPGGHEWPYWDRRIQPLLAAAKRALAGRD